MAFGCITQYIEYWSKVTPYKIAYTFFEYINGKRSETHITCRELYEKSCDYATYLKGNGVKKGDRVIIFAEQRPETIYSIYGTLLMGGIFILIPLPVNVNKRNRFSSTVESSKAKYIICKGKEEELIDEAINIINIDDIPMGEGKRFVLESNLEDIACLQYTSGSVNSPKGIMFSNKNIIASMKIMKLAYEIEEEEVNVSWLPFFHSMGLLVTIFLGAYTNARNIIMSLEVFQESPMRWLNAISKYSATIVIAPNSAYMTCSKMISVEERLKLDFSNVRHMINCSEIIQKSNWDTIEEAFGQYGLKPNTLRPMYGLSEATGPVSIGNGELCFIEADWAEVRNNRIMACTDKKKDTKTMSGVGKLVAGLKTLIINPITLEECAEHEIGEIWVQGASVAEGYWNNESVTKDTFKARLTMYEGDFLRTGDLGTLIDGELYITGRIKEMMVINGRNIYAKDIEINLKDNIEELKDVVMYAFTMPIKKRERIIIGIEYCNAQDETYIELVKKINQVMYKYFEFEAYDVFFTEENGLPRTDNGKLALMKIYHAYVDKNIEVLFSSRQYEKNKPSSEFTETQIQVKNIFEKVLDTKCNSVNDNFLNLGGSSLDIYNLLMQLKTAFNIYIGVKDFISNPTIGQLDEFIQKKKMQ